MAKPEISRFPCKELLCMPGSMTTQDRSVTRDIATDRVTFRKWDSVGILIESFAAQWLACTLPCQRFADTLADAYA
jgi:hypothetical protein